MTFPTKTLNTYTMAPNGFVESEECIFQITEGKQGEILTKQVCSKMRVVARARSSCGSDWSKLYAIIDPDGREQQVLVPDHFSFSKKKAMLIQKGLWISAEAPSKAFEELLNKWIPKHCLTLVYRLGWTDDKFTTFMINDQKALGDEKVFMQNRAVTTTSANRGTSGTLQDWRENVAKPCLDNPLLMIAVSHAFAGPLLAPLNIEGGGLHLRGGSSSGKTTILTGGLSVWGKPDPSDWSTTSNALEATLAAANSTFLAIDEIGSVSAKAAYDAAYMIGNGVGKARARSNGSSAEIAKWRTSVLSTGEISLEEKLAEDGRGKQDGQEVRLLDISADTRKYSSFDCLHGLADASAFADSLKDATLKFHGTAGEAFVRRLFKTGNVYTTAKKLLEHYLGAILKDKPNCGGIEKRAAKRFAIIATAGEMATRFGITGWPVGAAFSAAETIFLDWLEGRELPENAQISPEKRQAAIRRIFEFNQEKTSQILVLGGPPVETPVAYRDHQHLFLPPTTWETLHRNHDTYGLPKTLIAGGVLARGDGKNLQRKLPRAFNTGGSRAFAIKLSELQKWSDTSDQSEQKNITQDVNHGSDLSDRSDLAEASML